MGSFKRPCNKTIEGGSLREPLAESSLACVVGTNSTALTISNRSNRYISLKLEKCRKLSTIGCYVLKYVTIN